MNKQEIEQAQALIDSVMNGSEPLQPCTPVFPAKEETMREEAVEEKP